MTRDMPDGWLPPHVPSDVWRWEVHPRVEGHGFVRVRGTSAYEFVCVPDGRAIEIKAYIDGEMTHLWRRDPIDGIWPGEYEWQALGVYGRGLVQ
jgi:hypothetical protein